MTVRQIWRAWLLCAIAISHPSLCYASDEDTLNQYLQRLGLKDLQMQQLEQMIQLPRGDDQLKKDVKQLADLYVGQLLDAADDADRRTALVERVQRLIEKHPEAKTPALDVMLLQADYAAAEVAAEKWLAEPDDQQSRKTAGAILTRITPGLHKYLQQLDTKIESLVEKVDQATTEKQSEQAETELVQAQQVAGRARFYLGWSLYYQAALQSGDPAAKANFSKARDVFRKFLGVEEGYDDLSGEEMGLESPAIARAMVGLVQAEIGSGDLSAGRKCLKLLKDSQAPLELRQQDAFWYLQGLVNAGLIAEAAGFAESVLGEQSNANQASQLSVSVRSAVAGLARSNGNDPARRLGLAGVSGLTKLRRFQIARQLLDKYQVDVTGEKSFYLMWISGQQLLAKAETSKASDAFQKAADAFQQALEQPQAQQDKVSAARCRYELAYCQFKLGQHFQAAENYASMIGTLMPIDKTMAANAAWMAFAGYQRSLEEHPEGRRKAIRVLETLKRDFPDSPYADKVDYQISLLQRESQSPEEAMAELEAIKPGNENYVDSRFDLCLMSHKQWAAATGEAKSAAAAKVVANVDTFLGASHANDHSRRMKCLLVAADALINSPNPDLSSAKKYLGRAGAIASGSQPPTGTAPEYHYRMLQLSIKQRNNESIRRHANWITDNASGSPYELPALIQRAGNITGPEADPEEGYDVYRRLVRILGNDVEAAKSNKNARISLYNLAKYAAATGRFGEAAQAVDQVLPTDPKNRRYLTMSAESNYKAGNYSTAVDRYRMLVRGSKAGTDEWYDAKYHHIASLVKADPAKGKQVLKQFQLMHQDLGSPWDAKFQQLASEN